METKRLGDRRAPRTLLALVLGFWFVRAASAVTPSLTYPNLPTNVNTYTAVNGQAVETGLTPPFTFSVSPPLPDGLSLGTSTGAITGTPTTWPGGTFIITVTDANQQTAAYEGFFNVTPPIASEFNLIPDGSSSFNPASGEAAKSLRLLNYGGAPALTFTVYYSPFLAGNGVSSALGQNWATNYDLKLTISPTQVAAIFPDGRTAMFLVSGPSSFVLQYPAQFDYQLNSLPGGGYELFDPVANTFTSGPTFSMLAGTFSTFSSVGSLNSVTDLNGNVLNVTQGSLGPTQVTGPSGTLNFTYSGVGGLASVVGSDGSQVQLTQQFSRLTGITLPDSSQLKLTYTINGLLEGVTDQNGNNGSMTLDSESRLLTSTDPLHNQTSFVYSLNTTQITDPNNNVTNFFGLDSVVINKTTDPLNNSTSITFNSNFQPLQVTNPNGNIFRIGYDSLSGKPESLTDGDGNPITILFTPRPQGSFTAHDPTQVTFANNTIIGATYDSSGNLKTVTDPAGFIWPNTYTSQGSLLTATNPAGGTTSYSYDASQRQTGATDPVGNLIGFSYNSANLPIQVTLPDGKTQLRTWDHLHRPLTKTDENGGTTRATYDSVGNPTSLEDALGASQSWSYNANNWLTSSTNQLGKITRYQYDPDGNRIGTTYPDGEQITTTYSPLNLANKVTDGTGVSLSLGYDPARNLTSLTDGLGDTGTRTVDANGNTTSLISPLGETASFNLNSTNQLQSCIAPNNRTASLSYEKRGLLANFTVGGATTGSQLPSAISGSAEHAAAVGLGISASFAYDNLGQLSSRTDPNGNTWTVKDDNSGRVVSITDPLNRATSYTYDVRNRVNGSTNPLGSVQISYDGVGNETQRQYSDGTSFNFSYDADNRLVSATGVSLGFDAAGDLISSNGLTMTPDPVGKIATVTYAAGKTVTYTYDAGGRLTQVSDWAGGSVAFSYDGAGRLVSVSRSNGISTQYTYDNDSRVASIAESSGNQAIASIAYQRDAAGNVISETRNEPQVFTPAPGVAGFTYDAAEEPSGPGYASDRLGRLTQDPQGTLTWNLASNLTAYNIASQSSKFGYDALGMRTSATPASGPAQTYVVNYALALPSIATVQSGGADQRYYIYSPDGGLLYAIDAAGNAHHYYHFDSIGTTTFLSSDQGQVTDSYAVGPYGENVIAKGTTVNPFTWLGKWGVMQEGATGLYYMRARYYDSTSARFVSPDPIQHVSPLNIDPYVYASTSPLSNIDPRGTDDDDDELWAICLGGAGGTALNLGWYAGWRAALAAGQYIGLVEGGAWAWNFTINLALVSESFWPGGGFDRFLWQGALQGLWTGRFGNAVTAAEEEFENNLSTALAALNTEEGFFATIAPALKWVGTAGAIIGGAIQTIISVKQDVHNGLGWFLTGQDVIATVVSLAATYLTPWGAPLDFVTVGGISGGLHNLAFIPNAAAKVVLTRTNSQEQTAIKKVLTRVPITNAAWNLGERFTNTAAGTAVVNGLATVLGWFQ